MSQYLHIAYGFDVSIRSLCFHFIVGFSMSFNIYNLIFLGDCSYVLIFHELITWLNIRFLRIIFFFLDLPVLSPLFGLIVVCGKCQVEVVWYIISINLIKSKNGYSPCEYSLVLGFGRILICWERSWPIFLRLLNSFKPENYFLCLKWLILSVAKPLNISCSFLSNLL